ncbi:MAG: class I poly(R)-hydroxyalkanoic acid synthase [Rhodospirillaceae bacterium]|nr:MAG: class I poly(R)-hydroxyalkanoic acid synthase [Rhodospirillaceae bacterium]
MNDQPNSTTETKDFDKFSKNLTKIAEKSQKIVQNFLTQQMAEDKKGSSLPPALGAAFLEMTQQMMTNPEKAFAAQMKLWQDHLALWQHTANHAMGTKSPPVIQPQAGDRRFKDPEWDDNPLFSYIKQSYLLMAGWMQSHTENLENMDEGTVRMVDFYTRQFVDAIAPSNFALTNPEVLRATAESGGENLVNGLQNLLNDLERGEGQLRITQTDPEAFKLGETIATTKGEVIYQNDLMQLLQFTPTTENVYKRPLLMIPPWINKYYILDLSEKNSFVRWALDQGHTVFIISWVNPDATLAKKTFEDYMHEGPLAALDAIQKATGEDAINVLGYCIGGTLLATTLAYLAVKKDTRVHSATFLTAMVDFEDAGELSVFIDEAQLADLEQKMEKRGYLEGHEMAAIFNRLRANDLIWSFVVNNYLLGKDPFPFDLLFWNSDSTRMPAAMHSFYLRRMYLENKLIEPGGLTFDGVPIDLRKIEVPTYILACREDHIAPWKSTYAATQLYRGPVRFVLSASGHVAGVVNPPKKKKYNFWTADKNPNSPDAWLENAAATDGSWWTDWGKWLAKKGGKKVPARKVGSGALKAIEPAPGSYAKVREI